MNLFLEIPAAILAADFLSGLAHWLEDSYFTPATPLLGRTIELNVLHHAEPGKFVSKPWHETIRSSVASALVVALALAAAGQLGRFWIMTLALAAFANQIHKWAHLDRGELPRLVGLLQSGWHHLRHHAGDKNTRYCVITPFLNQVLDRAGFWRGIEGLVHLLSGVAPRPQVQPEAA